MINSLVKSHLKISNEEEFNNSLKNWIRELKYGINKYKIKTKYNW